jgi:large conductance mechanosensitive channel
MLGGFRNFLFRGNVVDLAVGVVIGTAFGAIVDGFIKAFMDPIIAVILGASGAAALETVMVGIFPIGLFISAIIRFLLIALVVYLFIIRPFADVSKRLAANSPPPPEILLLTEIRDLLKERTP